jgi:hypothetical protein
MAEYTIGVDLGQSRDPTAIAIVRKVRGEETVSACGIYRLPAPALAFQVGHLERLPLHTPYPGVVSHVLRLLAKFPDETELVIDHTGVGRPVFDLFETRGLSPIGVTITGGDTITHESMIWRVPKMILVSQVQARLHDGRLKIQKELPDGKTLVDELQDFRAETNDNGYWRFGARSGKHDDLVLALAIALWRAGAEHDLIVEPLRI